MNRFKMSFCIFMLGCSIVASAQKATMKVNDFAIAVDLFENQKYSAAQQHFKVVTLSTTYMREQQLDAEYYAAVCALRLFNPDGPLAITKFINNNP